MLPHGIGLGLGGADPPDRGRLRHLGALADALEAPLVSDHVAFVRAGGLEAGHLLPLARTQYALDVVCANIEIAQAALPVALAVENVAALLDWPNPEMTEAQFLHRIVERTGVLLLLDVANLHANDQNLGLSALDALDDLPLSQIAYVHVAGGVERDDLYHDTHAHPVPAAVLDLLAQTCRRTRPRGCCSSTTTAIRPTRTWPPSWTPSGRCCAVPQPEPRLTQARLRQAADQAELLRALVAGAPPPAGFALHHLSQQARVLTRKRGRGATRATPVLAQLPSAEFQALFAAYSREHPLRNGETHGDGWRFVRWLSFNGRDLPPDQSRLTRLIARATWRSHR